MMHVTLIAVAHASKPVAVQTYSIKAVALQNLRCYLVCSVVQCYQTPLQICAAQAQQVDATPICYA